MIEIKSRKRLLQGALIVLAALLVVGYAARQGIYYREVIIVGAALATAVIVFGREMGIQLGFVLWALSMAIGYRTFEFSKDLRFHVAEALLWLLFAGMFVHRRLTSDAKVSLPLWVWLSLPFWIFGWWPLVGGEANWAAMFSEFRCFLILIPLLLVAQVVLKEQRHWRYLLLAFFVASTWIALMGALEYWVPAVTKLFPAFIVNVKAQPTADGFMRAQFSFWGSPNATFLCALSFPMCIVLWRWWRSLGMRLMIAIATILQLVAIYIGGYRSLWVMVVIQVSVACVFGLRKRGLAVAALCVVVAGVGYQFIPRTDERVITTIAALRLDPVDHSALVRKERALGAVDDVFQNPLGGGWNSAGWVHSDFLQVAVNLGILAALIFVGGYVYTFWKLAIGVRSAARISPTDQGELGFSLLLAFISVGGLLTTQGVQVLPQFILPVWFVWALIEVWLRQRAAAPELSYAYAPYLYPVADVQ